MNHIKSALKKVIIDYIKEQSIEEPEIIISACRVPEHGDITSNVAFLLSKSLKKPPQAIATEIASYIELPYFDKVEAVAGYVNCTISYVIKCEHIAQWLEHGVFTTPNGVGRERILMEFVSANPTGPLHVGHGRQAAVADTLVRIFRNCGHHVDTEYYVNDAGMQMDVLLTSVWVRMLKLKAWDVSLIKGLYQGEYVQAMAELLISTLPEVVFDKNYISLFKEAESKAVVGDADAEIIVLKLFVSIAKTMLGVHAPKIQQAVLEIMMRGIVEELEALGVVMDQYASEQSYVVSGSVDKVLEDLKSKNLVFEDKGALWFASTAFGDDKDRVLVRSNGERTYFTNDIAYHKDKGDRGYTRLINFLGSDHHGYVTRLQSALKAVHAGIRLDVRLVQFVHLIKHNERIAMSTRQATFEPLLDVIKTCGRDATRYFYIAKHLDQPLDFDMDLAITQNQENPVFYVQYAHARMCRLLEKVTVTHPQGTYILTPEENALWETLGQYETVLTKCMEELDPCYLASYVYDISKKFHNYYNNVAILQTPEDIQVWRVALVAVLQRTLSFSLEVLGISAPVSM